MSSREARYCGIRNSVLRQVIADLQRLIAELPDTVPIEFLISNFGTFGPPVTDFLVAFIKDAAKVIQDPLRTYSDVSIFNYFAKDEYLRQYYYNELSCKVHQTIHFVDSLTVKDMEIISKLSAEEKKIFLDHRKCPNRGVDYKKLRRIFPHIFYATCTRAVLKMDPKLSDRAINRLTKHNRKKMILSLEIIDNFLRHAFAERLKSDAEFKRYFQRTMKELPHFCFSLKRYGCDEELKKLLLAVQELHQDLHIELVFPS